MTIFIVSNLKADQIARACHTKKPHTATRQAACHSHEELA